MTKITAAKAVAPSIRNEKIAASVFARMVYKIWLRNFLQFKRTWLISLVWIIIEPVLILTAIGFGVGSFVPTMEGIPYVDYFYPALICISSMFVAYFVSTYDNFTKLTHQKLFATQILTPIEPREIVYGEIFWAATKGTLGAAGVSFVALFFGLVNSFRIFPALGVVFFSSMVFAAFGMLITTYVKNYDQIIYPTSGIIIPISLFSGTYFPLDHLPYGLKYISYISPLTHSVRLVRSLMLSGFSWDQLPSLIFLIVLAGVLTKLCVKRLSQIILD